MKKPRKYFVLYGGEFKNSKVFHTDDIHVAERIAILRDGQVWEDTRYEARIRLHWFLVRKQMYS